MSEAGAERERRAAVEERKDAHYPCPACDSTLFGWTAAHDPLDRGKKIVLDRCETCGLAVTRQPEPPDADAELEALIDAGESNEVEIVAPNRRSFQGAIGGAQWAGLEPELRRLHLTPDSLRRLLAQRGLELTAIGTPFRNRAFRLMWQTLINAFTYRDNFLRNRRTGRLPEPESGRERFLYGLDWLVSMLVALPAAMFALPLELLATVFARGGVLTATARRIRGSDSEPAT
jgi:transcription elongation factor Elf1